MSSRKRYVVKKYPNRRLYDTEESRYITLDGLKQLIRRGRPVSVIEAKSGKDISREVLLQLVAEQEALGRPILTESFLLALIRFYDHPLQKLASRYLELSLSQLRDQQARMLEQFRKLARSPAGFAGGLAEDISRYNAEWTELLQRTFFDAIGSARKDGEQEPSLEDADETDEKDQG